MVTRIVVWAALAGVLGAGCVRAPPTSPTAAASELRIEEHFVTVKGTKLPLGGPLADWKRVLGEPSRYVDRAGGIYVWDELGLMISLRLPFAADDPHVAALRVAFRPRDVDFWPRHPYPGPITFVQEAPRPEEVEFAGEPAVVATLAADTIPDDLTRRQRLSTRYGFPSLGRYTTVRWATDPSKPGEPIGLELCSVAMDPEMARLPWEIEGYRPPARER